MNDAAVTEEKRQWSHMDEDEWTHHPKLLEEGDMKTRDGLHTIHWKEFGKKDGEPVIIFHGGPGAGCEEADTKFFKDDRYRVILFDQRGCGGSTPNAGEDPVNGLKANTTQDLINDIDQLREERGIKGKMHVFGGSWGSTLALTYAIKRPTAVQSLVLRGIFLGSGTKNGLDYQYQGNAATYEEHPDNFDEPGTYRAYLGDGKGDGQIPRKVYTDLYGEEKGNARYDAMAAAYAKAWDDFVTMIPKGDERKDMVKAYAKIFAHVPKDKDEKDHQDEALRRWTVWEGATSYLNHDVSDLGKFADIEFGRTFGRIENHYFMNGCFLGGKSGEANRDNRWILDNLDKIKDIPTYIVHGKHDQVAPIHQAYELKEAMQDLKAKHVELHDPVAGHSRKERGIALKLTEIMDNMPPMKEKQTPLNHAEREGGDGSPPL